ncbi:hypothetical protein MBLNU459_g5072t1 [Dothideomycetes sp. NU459]
MAAPPPQQGQPMMMPQPGQQPTPEQIQAMQRQLAIEAQKHGMTVQQYVEQLRMQAMRQHQMQQQMQQQQGGGQPQQPPQQGGPPPQQQQQQQQQQQLQQQQQQQQQQQIQPIQPGPPKPEAIAMANFLRSQDLKQRTCIFQEKRKDMFKVKRAIRALHTPAYEKARKKNPLLPPVTDRVTAENAFKLLPMSLLALRVSKIPDESHDGHGHAKKKRVKGLWNVRIEQAQEAGDEFHYMWMYEGSQWKMKLYAAGALALILAVVFFPVWPYRMRVGVWYLSMACLGLLGLFFAMAIFRLILFVLTMFAVPPGLWLYPNLFEDVGFFDSFKPLWGWQETAEDKKRAKEAKKAKKAEKRSRRTARVQEVEAEEEEGEGEEQEGEEEGEGEGSGSGDEGIHKEDISGPVGVTSGAELHAHGERSLQHRGATVEEVEDDD